MTKRGADSAEQGPSKSHKALPDEDAKRLAAEAVASLQQKPGQRGETAVPVGKVPSPQGGGLPPVLVAPKIPDLDSGRLLGAWSVMRDVIPWAPRLCNIQWICLIHLDTQ